MKTAFRRASAAVSAFVLSACMLQGGDPLVSPGGAEDFPNTVTALGRIAIDDISSGMQWEQAGEVELPPAPDLGGLDSLRIEPPQSPGAARRGATLAKAAVDTLDLELWEVDDTRLVEVLFTSRVYAYAVDSTAEYVRRDTVTALFLGSLSGGVFDSVQADLGRYLLPVDYRGAVRWSATGVRQSYRLRNLDNEGDMDIAEYVTVTPIAEGGSLRKRVSIHGVEGAFREPNPVPEEYELLRRGAAGDTLEWTLIRDADWDRRLWGDSGRGVVDLFLRVKNPPSQPAVSRMHVAMRAVYRPDPSGDSIGQLQYQEQRWLRNGRNVTFTLRGTGEGGVLRADDTARMTVDTVYALRDSMIQYTAVYELLLGSAPDRMQEHRMRGYGISKFWRTGPVFSSVSLFAPAEPVAVGQAEFEGEISFTAAYVNGDTVRSEGAMGPAGLDLTVRQIRDGAAQTWTVVIDAAGNLVEAAPVVADATLTRRAPPR